jgi:hypothetical protein
MGSNFKTMKMKYIVRLFVLNILALTFISCETTERLEDFPLKPSRLVANCYFSNGSPWEIQVSKSLSVLDNAEIKFIKDAEISIYKGGVLIDTMSVMDNDNFYRSSRVLPEIGSAYELRVSAPEFDSVLIASDIVPEPVFIKNAELTIIDSNFYSYQDYYTEEWVREGNFDGKFEIEFKDPDGIENYYRLMMFKTDSFYREVFDENYNIIPDSFVLEVSKYPVYFLSSDIATATPDRVDRLLFSDVLFDGLNYKVVVEFDDWISNRNHSYEFELSSLSKSAYFYWQTLDVYRESHQDPFSEPTQIYSNIENGLGIFTSFVTSKYQYTIEL